LLAFLALYLAIPAKASKALQLLVFAAGLASALLSYADLFGSAAAVKLLPLFACLEWSGHKALSLDWGQVALILLAARALSLARRSKQGLGSKKRNNLSAQGA